MISVDIVNVKIRIAYILVKKIVKIVKIVLPSFVDIKILLPKSIPLTLMLNLTKIQALTQP